MADPRVLAVTAAEFSTYLRAACPDIEQQHKIAVAVSGGPDSLALLWLLAETKKFQLHALTVDHGLRAASSAEAKTVAHMVSEWPGVTHKTLVWRGRKPTTRISEAARAARYRLMAAYCKKQGITHLFVAHHQDDQAETFLLRLAAGSGLDGLAGMRPQQAMGDIVLVRPLLNVPRARLQATLRTAKIKWINDPTNKNEAYARPRLRAAQKILAREGLTPERLATTAARLARGRAVIEALADDQWNQLAVTENAVTVPLAQWNNWPEDIRIRLLARAVAHVGAKSARLEQIEMLEQRLRPETNTIRATLAGCLVTRGAKNLTIRPEPAVNRRRGTR